MPVDILLKHPFLHIDGFEHQNNISTYNILFEELPVVNKMFFIFSTVDNSTFEEVFKNFCLLHQFDESQLNESADNLAKDSKVPK